MIATPPERGLAARAAGHPALQDAAFLAVVTVLSLVSYVGRLGFYLDDYRFLRVLGQSHSQSFLGLYSHLHDEAAKTRFRPVQIAMLAGLYKLFGDDPHPYHVFNAAVLVSGVVLVYLLLRELGQSRLVAVAVALLYSTLPHFSTDRFWVAAFQANVSMTLYFLSQYAALRAVRARGGRWLAWGALATAAAVASVLAYEVALPLFVLTPFLVAYRSRQLPRTDSTRRRSRLLLAAALVALGAALAAKLVVAVRVGHESSYQLGASGGVVHHLGYLVRGGVAVNGGTYGLALPYVTGWVVLHRLGWIVAVLALVTAGGVFLYLRRLARSEWELPTATFATRIILAGIAVVALGYAVFITNSEIFFTSAGVDNRVNIAAGFGMAIVLVGLVGWAAAHLPPRARSSGFAGALAALCAAGFVIVNGLASFWITAAQRQDAVLDGIQAHLPAGTGQTTVLLDGICPEVGPGVVFTTQYDLTGALYLRYHDSRLEGAALSPQVQARPKALWIANYFNGQRTSLRSYPYGSSTYVYDYPRDTLHRLVDAAAARRYFRVLSSRPDCPPIRSFDWGIPGRYRRVLP